MIFPYDDSLFEQKIRNQKFLSSTPSTDNDLFRAIGNLPNHCDFIFSSAKLAELLPIYQMLEN